MPGSNKEIIVIPTYREAENISLLVSSIMATRPDINILFIDDNSPDNTADRIREMQSLFPEKIFMLSRAQKLGLGSAYVAGFDWALKRGYEKIISMDADQSHNPSYLPQLVSGLDKYDCVIGSRYVPGGSVTNWGALRKILSRGASIYARRLLGLPIRDLTGGFNAWRSAALAKLDLHSIASDGYVFQIELKYRAFKHDCSLVEIPIVFIDRMAGASKMSGRIIIEALWRTPWLRFMPLQNKE